MLPSSDLVPRRPLPHYDPPSETPAVIYVDEEVLVLDKPSGLLTVPGKQPGADDCLESRAQSSFDSARIVHRLDWDTSGLVIMGRTPGAQTSLGRQFESRTISKRYIARVWGNVSKNDGEIDLPLRCDWPNRPRQIVDHDQGKTAQTYWEVLSRADQTTDLLMRPCTGRTHQLRVHCQHLGHPIVGDRLYAHDEAYLAHSRMCLHASAIGFDHPITGERIQLKSDCPF